MDAFELNKVFCAVLATVCVVMSLTFASEGLFHAQNPEIAGYNIEVADAPVGGGDEDTGPAFDPVEPLLASADAAAGEAVFKKCAGCHNVVEGGANGTGPALHGIVGRGIAVHDGYGFSKALVAYGEGKAWTFEELHGFLWKRKNYINCAAMGFAGINKVQDRADLIKYITDNSSAPLALPEG